MDDIVTMVAFLVAFPALFALLFWPRRRPMPPQGSLGHRLAQLDEQVLGPPTAAERWAPADRREFWRFALTRQGPPRRSRPSRAIKATVAAYVAAVVLASALHAPPLAGALITVAAVAAMLVLLARDQRRQSEREAAAASRPARPE